MWKLVPRDIIRVLALLAVLLLVLTGCELPRSPNAGADVAPVTEAAPAAGSPAAPAPASPVPGAPTAGAAQETGTVILIQPAQAQLNVGDTTTVEVRVDNVTGLSAADVQIQFVPAVLQAQDADPAKEGIQIQPGNLLSPDFVVTNEADNGVGTARYALTQVAPTAPANGSGVLFSVTFQAVAEGVSSLTFVLSNLATSDGQPIAATTRTSQVAVGQGQVPTVTLTPVPGEPTATPIVVLPTSTFTPVPGVPTPTFTPLPPPTLTPTPLPAITPTPVSPPVTPVPPVTALPAGANVGFCYRVQAGDTLFSLGQQFGVDFWTIARVNGLRSPNMIFVHQGLFIPEQFGGYGPNVYVAKAGDTLNSIAESCNLPLGLMATVNNLPRDTAFQAGHVVIIPIPPPLVAPRPSLPCCPPPPPPCYPRPVCPW